MNCSFKKQWFYGSSLFFCALFLMHARGSDHSYYQPKRHVFLVHGTFAKDQSWYQRDGDFYDSYLSQIPFGTCIYSFTWSGRCSHAHREKAARLLAEIICWYCRPGDTIILVGHSHGGNVCILAANELAKCRPAYRIKKLFSLGTPVSYAPDYTPNMDHIDRLYHFFSFGDMVQPVFSLFNRVFKEHPRIWNIGVKIDGVSPSHSDLRSPALVHFLKQADRYHLANDKTVLHLKSDGSVTFEYDDTRQELLFLEKENFSTLFSEALSRKFIIHDH